MVESKMERPKSCLGSLNMNYIHNIDLPENGRSQFQEKIVHLLILLVLQLLQSSVC